MDFKLSHYIVATDTLDGSEDENSKRILFATRTAKPIVVTNRLYSKMLTEAWDEIEDADFERMLNIEAIVPSEDNEVRTIIERNQAVIRDGNTLYQVIQPTAMCQLGCGYCGQKHTKDYVSKSTSDLILERIESKFALKDYTHFEIAWFGSEPLVGYAQIRELTPILMKMAEKHGCTYSAKVVTNGLSLKEPIFLELVKKLGVTNIEVTLDGTAEYHDARRHTKDGLSTFNLIFANLLKIFNRPDYKELGCSLSIRCNVDERNDAGVTPLLKLLAEHNLQDKIAYFYVAPIHSWGNDAHLLSLEKSAFADREIEWIIDQYKYGFKPGLLPSTKPVVCLSVTPDSDVYDAFGNVHDCTEVTYVDGYKDTDYVLGNVNNGLDTISKHRPLLSFNDEVADGKYPCSSCKMLPVCGGACPKSWREGIVACPTNKSNIQDKLMIHYAIKKKGTEEFLTMLQD